MPPKRNWIYWHRLLSLCICFCLTSACEFSLAAGETLCDPRALISAIRRANSNPDPTVIRLPRDCTIELTEANNTTSWSGGRENNGLPVIATPITLQGGENTVITRRASAPEFRILYIDGASGGQLTLESVMIANGSERNGGEIFNDEGVLRLGAGSQVSGNRATDSGGGIFSWNGIVETPGAGSAFVSNNVAGDSGGGIYAIRNASLSGDVGRNNLILNAMVFERNVAETQSGGALYTNADRFAVTDSTFSENAAAVSGGALYIAGGNGSPATIERSEFSSNSATRGGAIDDARGDSGELAAGGEPVSLNERGSAGLIINQTTFFGNSANEGGALYVGEEVYISQTLFVENDAEREGGAIKIWPSGLLDISNSTFSANLAPQAPAIYNFGQAYINYITITNSRGEGALFSWYSTIEIANVIVAENSGSDCGFNHPPLRVLENNLDSDGSCGFNITQDPRVGPLRDNGGPTETHALLLGSPAIDAATGSCPETDQRDGGRPLGVACDLGAYEARPIELPNVELPVATPLLPDISKLIVERDFPCYTGPGPQYNTISTLKAGTEMQIAGYSFGGGWLVAYHPTQPNRLCWIDEDFVKLNVPIGELRLIAIPPKPTSTPSATREPRVPTACATTPNYPMACD